MRKAKYFLWKFFKLFGVEVLPDERKNSLQSYLLDLVERSDINYIIDVGSNKGQFYTLLRSIGFKGEVELFEPLIECKESIIRLIKKDKLVRFNGFALGDKEGRLDFHVTRNNVSSSLLMPVDTSKVARSYQVDLRTLDSLDLNLTAYSKVLLKIDAQGYERNVIMGALRSLTFIDYILLELSMSAQYVGEVEMIPMFEYMKNQGYSPIFIYPGVTNKSNEVIQYEVIFKRDI